MVAKRIHNLYCFQGNEACRVAQLTHSTLPEWYERFGYLNENNLMDVIRQKKVSGIKAKPDGKLPLCETCIKWKQVQNTYRKSNSTTKNLLELVHTDVGGPVDVCRFHRRFQILCDIH